MGRQRPCLDELSVEVLGMVLGRPASIVVTLLQTPGVLAACDSRSRSFNPSGPIAYGFAVIVGVGIR